MELPFTGLPPEIDRVLRGRDWSSVQIGLSAADVFRIDGGLYLKTLVRNHNDSLYGNLAGEMARLEWLQGKVSVPEIVAFVRDEARDYLVMTEVRGSNAAILKPTHAERRRVMESMAVACRELHAIDASEFPFVETSDALIETAKQRLRKGLVDCDDFDEERLGRDPWTLIGEMVALRPERDDLVLTHGDLCLPNIVIAGEEVSGFVDVGRAAVADRWRDLALCMRSAWFNWGDDAAEEFLTAYGVPNDVRKREFHALLDEFF